MTYILLVCVWQTEVDCGLYILEDLCVQYDTGKNVLNEYVQ